MRVRVSYTIDVDDTYRRAIRHHYGEKGLADREEIIAWCKSNGDSCDDDILWELAQEEGDSAPAAQPKTA